MKNIKFQNIALIGRPGKGTRDTVSTVADHLADLGVKVTIETKTAKTLDSCPFPTFLQDNLPKNIDLILVIGGDGSLLNAAHLALPHNLPVLGINRGRLGFLTDIHPNALDKIDDVLFGNYQAEERFLLSTTHQDGHRNTHEDVALNDVVLLPGDLAQMIEFDIFIDDHLVCHQRADGLIIATPTGSTAYALSGGGPILHPQLNAIALVPMFPHTLSSRPIVVSGDANITLLVNKMNDASPYVSCDGQRRVPITPGSKIHIHKHQKQLKLIHPENYEYFATLREKLGWQTVTKRTDNNQPC